MYHPMQYKLIRGYFTCLNALSPDLALYSAYRLFHRPVNPKRRNRNAKPLPPAESFFVPMDDDRAIQAYRWGPKEAPAVLLVHGWSTNPESMSHFASLLLENGYRVFSYDALRHGRSSHTFSDLADWADSVRAVMASIGPVECIIAHSFGGAAVTVASKLGLETKKLVLVSPIHDIRTVVRNFAVHFGIPSEIVERLSDYTWHKNAERFSKYGKDWSDIVTSAFHVPTLIFHDEADREIGIEHSRHLCQKWPWAELHTTKGLGHRRILDDETVAKEILRFIRNDSQ
ncbi:alpha/beta hydrolase [Sulfurovum riftiae]|uniref:AB hydrolase-1 domain-containing protein n=1 Tax=Sulfurovum riftiae TaxID=1630136 RepID=A0A151CID1_9BACT|nr:alpha/beta hydrolase [Sulfurovum riftiae]KYJ87276.1 hypothetical protein AS592_02750 [Sulfurovum riftiae]